jgi:hypothetical protein
MLGIPKASTQSTDPPYVLGNAYPSVSRGNNGHRVSPINHDEQNKTTHLPDGICWLSKPGQALGPHWTPRNHPPILPAPLGQEPSLESSQPVSGSAQSLPQAQRQEELVKWRTLSLLLSSEVCWHHREWRSTETNDKVKIVFHKNVNSSWP